MGKLRVTVYSKPLCVQCDSTKRQLIKLGVEFTEEDLTSNEAAFEYVTKDLGYSQAPVVVVEDGTGQDHWSGFRPDNIKRVARVEVP